VKVRITCRRPQGYEEDLVFLVVDLLCELCFSLGKSHTIKRALKHGKLQSRAVSF
jgi:hypothetical protein